MSREVSGSPSWAGQVFSRIAPGLRGSSRGMFSSPWVLALITLSGLATVGFACLGLKRGRIVRGMESEAGTVKAVESVAEKAMPARKLATERVPFPGVLNPTLDLEDYEAREYRVVNDPELIQRKLDKELHAAMHYSEERYPNFGFGDISHLNYDRLGGAQTLITEPLTVGVAEVRGRRRSMEDTTLQAEGKTLNGTSYKVTAVFDGHGGTQCSIHAKEKFVSYLQDRLDEEGDGEMTDRRVWNALKLACVDFSRSSPEDGTTANIAVLIGRDLWVANVGDSRALLLHPDGEVQPLSEDAKPTNPRYERGIKNRGSEVWMNRVGGNLAVARAMGDHFMGGAISARPKITRVHLEPGQDYHLIQCCDGVFDVASSEDVGAYVKRCLKLSPDLDDLAGQIVKHAFEAGSTDNITASVALIEA